MKRVCFLVAEEIRYQYPTVKLLADELELAGIGVDIFSRSYAHRAELAERHRFRCIGYVPRWDHHGKAGKIEFLARGLTGVGRYDAYLGVCNLGILLAHLLARRRFFRPLVAYLPEIFPVRSAFERYADRCARSADALIDVDEERLAHRAMEGPLPKATFCVGNVPALRDMAAVVAAPRPARQGPPVVWYHGTLSPGHGIGELVEGFARMRAPAELHLTGPGAPGYLSELKNSLARCGKPALLHDPLPRDQVLQRAAALADLAVCFYPFRMVPHEVGQRLANPAKVFDYMALGLPALTSDNPTLVRLVAKEGWGTCVPPEDPAAVAAALDQLVSDAALRQRMGSRARELFFSRYHLERVARPFVTWLCRTVGA
ncbi:MAG: glycosyltransferase [Armatimonadota bacterium]|nr:glycosyltransferase [Armatimonadota bacterium]